MLLLSFERVLLRDEDDDYVVVADTAAAAATGVDFELLVRSFLTKTAWKVSMRSLRAFLCPERDCA